MRPHSSQSPGRPERDDFSSNRHPALTYAWSMIPRVEPEGMLFRKPVPTPDQVRGRLFRDHALTVAQAMVWMAPAWRLTAPPPRAMMVCTIREAVMRAQARAHAIPLDYVDLEALDRFLMSDRSPPDSMMLSDLDGFLSGIAIGPELVLPSEWLPLVWG